MLGAITGDIIGSRFEWDNIKHTDFELFAAGCRFTDDTVHTVAVADALMGDGDFSGALKAYYRRYPDAGYGARFLSWAAGGDTQPYGSYGNGSAMRVSPTAWLFDTLAEVVEAAEMSAAVTHNHPEGIRGARCIAGAVFLGRRGARRDEIRRWVADDCGYELGASCDEIRPAHRFDVSCRGTVGPAIQAFLESSDFEHGVRLAISLGGDSDTLACITASVGEAYYGGVPAPIAARAWAFLDPHLRGVVRRFFQVTGRELPLACD